MDLFIDPEHPRGITRSLYGQLRGAITSGRVEPGDRLPPSRELARQLGVARQTVAGVYGRLAAEGHAVARGAAGTFVADSWDPARSGREQSAKRSPWPAPPRDANDEGPTRFDLRSGTPDLALFPLRDWQRAIHGVSARPPTGYGAPAGLPELRRVLARRAASARGVLADPDQLVVTAGAQAAVDLTLRLLSRPGDLIALEEPGYPPVRDLVRSLGRRVAPIPVDAEGIRPELIPPEARVVYTTPSHQAPTGSTLTLDRRRQLLALAQRHDQFIIEDDYDSEHRHVDRPLEPLFALDDVGRVVYIATFSKTLSPGLRLGYACYPPDLAPHAVALRALTDVQPADLVQRAMHRFITDGLLDRHLRRVGRVYRERHAIVSDFVAAQAAAGHASPFAVNNAGLHIALRLAHGTERQLAQRLTPAGIRLGDYGACWSEPPDHEGAIIGFGNIATPELRSALRELGRALAKPAQRRYELP